MTGKDRAHAAGRCPADKIAAFQARRALIIFQVKDNSHAGECRRSGTGAQAIGDMRATLPAGVIGIFNDGSGDVYGSIYALSGRRLHAQSCGPGRLRAPSAGLKVKTSTRCRSSACGTKVFIEIRRKRLAQLGLDINQVIAQIGAPERGRGRRRDQRRQDYLQCVRGVSSTPSRSWSAFRSGAANRRGSTIRLATSPEIRRAYARPAGGQEGAPPGREVIALGVSWPRAATSSTWAGAARGDRAIQRELPLGITLKPCRTSRPAVRARSASSSAC